MKNRGLVALLFLLITVNEARVVNRCELGRELIKVGLDKFPGVDIADWLCLAFFESRFNTRALWGPNPDGARNYGIFQINGHWWCAEGKKKPNFGCGIKCKALLDDNIVDDVACIKLIAAEPKRMDAWAGWRKNCKGKDLSRWTRTCKF